MGILRLILALSVYFIHTGWINGFVIFQDRFRPVYSFFIISGFYMAFILNKKYVGNKGSYSLFITNRFLRIYPIYWVVILISIMFSSLMLLNGINIGGALSYLSYYSFLMQHNFWMLPVVITADIIRNISLVIHCGYFTRCDYSSGLSTAAQAWTLNLELLFYMIAPFLLRKKGLTRWLVIAGVFLTWYIIFHFQLLSFYSTGYQFMHAMKFFMLGFISFILYEKLPFKKIPRLSLIAICSIFILTILMYAHIPLPDLRFRWLIFNDYIFYLIVTASVPFLFQLSNIFRFDALLGQLSYPIYITHLLTNDLLISTNLVKPNTQLFIVIGLIWVLIFSLGMTYLIENPIDKFRQKRIAVVKLPEKIKKRKMVKN